MSDLLTWLVVAALFIPGAALAVLAMVFYPWRDGFKEE